MTNKITIPVFPLSGALLLPEGNLPLNIFEPRYISMVDYALSKDKLIGIVQPLKVNSEKLFNIGCVGKIKSYSETEDSRYLINLVGTHKFKIINEIKHNRSFKMFEVVYQNLKNDYFQIDNKLFNRVYFVNKVKEYLKNYNFDTDWEFVDNIDDKSLITMIAMICPFSPSEKQALLETENINELISNIETLLDFGINKKGGHESLN